MPGVTKQVHQIKIFFKYNAQYMFLQPTLSATILKSIFHFRICIPTSVLEKIHYTQVANVATLLE